MLYLTIVFVLLAVYVSWRLQGSRIGRAWAALREDETTAQAMGVDTTKAKLMAFVAGAMISSFAGALFAAKVGSVFPNSFELLVSIVILVIVIVGGMGHIPGVLLGAVVLIGILGGPRLPGLLQEFQDYKMLIYGTLAGLHDADEARGLLPSVRRTRELHQEEFLQDAWFDKKGHFTDDPDATGAEVAVAEAAGLPTAATARTGRSTMSTSMSAAATVGTDAWSGPLLEIRGLKKNFGGIQALGGVDFTVERGSIVSVIGPNGAGKTSFFNVISGLFPPDEGEIFFKGEDIAGLPRTRSPTGASPGPSRTSSCSRT
jgi:ABC-type multidrug transport system fused ATPase/permease subunit